MDKPARSSDAPPPSVEEFLKTVVRSGLLERDNLLEALRGFPVEQRQDTLALAEHLIRSGKLSRFQARKLMQGVARGLILGSFQILSMIGKGGMGRVYLARDSRNGQLIALKVLPPSKARSKERLLVRFQREMELNAEKGSDWPPLVTPDSESVPLIWRIPSSPSTGLETNDSCKKSSGVGRSCAQVSHSAGR